MNDGARPGSAIARPETTVIQIYNTTNAPPTYSNPQKRKAS